MTIGKIWLFRILGIAATVLMVAAFVLPWWTCDILMLGITNAMTMHPYGLELDPNMAEYSGLFKESLPPFWLIALAFIFIVAAAGALLASLFLRPQIGRLLLVAVGVAFLGFVMIASAFTVYSLSQFGISPIGYSYLEEGVHVPYSTGVEAHILPGYYVAWAAALISIVLALLRSRITGEPNVPFFEFRRPDAAA